MWQPLKAHGRRAGDHGDRIFYVVGARRGAGRANRRLSGRGPGQGDASHTHWHGSDSDLMRDEWRGTDDDERFVLQRIRNIRPKDRMSN